MERIFIAHPLQKETDLKQIKDPNKLKIKATKYVYIDQETEIAFYLIDKEFTQDFWSYYRELYLDEDLDSEDLQEEIQDIISVRDTSQITYKQYLFLLTLSQFQNTIIEKYSQDKVLTEEGVEKHIDRWIPEVKDFYESGKIYEISHLPVVSIWENSHPYETDSEIVLVEGDIYFIDDYKTILITAKRGKKYYSSDFSNYYPEKDSQEIYIESLIEGGEIKTFKITGDVSDYDKEILERYFIKFLSEQVRPDLIRGYFYIEQIPKEDDLYLTSRKRFFLSEIQKYKNPIIVK